MVIYFFSFGDKHICIVGHHLVIEGMFVSVRDDDDHEIAVIYRPDITRLSYSDGKSLVDGGDLLAVLPV